MGKRYIIRQNDVENIIKMYKNGKSITMISILMNLRESDVKSIVKRNLGMYTDTYQDKNKKLVKRPLKSEIERKKIIELYKEGKTIKEISSMLGIIDMYTESILVGAKLINPLNNDKQHGSFITVDDIKRFRDAVVKEGQSYVVRQEIIDDFGRIKTKRIVAKVLKKYPYIVDTDKGCFQYFDLYINRNAPI